MYLLRGTNWVMPQKTAFFSVTCVHVPRFDRRAVDIPSNPFLGSPEPGGPGDREQQTPQGHATDL
jgi:hypothetical protein